MVSKLKTILQIIFIYSFVLLLGWLSNHLLLNIHDHWIIIITSILEVLLVVFMLLKIDKKPMSSVGLRLFSAWDYLYGLILGIVLYLLQILPPILIMKMDTSSYGKQFNPYSFLLDLIFLTLTVGFAEEIIFRGFIFNKLNQLVTSKPFIVLMNCILFYCAHLPKTLTIDVTHIYSTFVTSILFCSYLFISKKKTIVPLIIAHGLYDTLMSGYGLVFLNLLFK